MKIILWILAVLIVLVIVILLYFFAGKIKVSNDIIWGVDFSQSQAEYLKLDWKKTYLAIINDLGAKNIKLHTNWSWVEGIKGNFYFNDIDWQIEQAEKNNIKLIYVLGLKTGRWPECHMPKWADSLSEQQQKDATLNYITEIVQRYKNSKAIVYWQVENEPLFKFGECPDWYYKNSDFLKQEISLVKSLDPSRQIIISDSGEQSMWFGPAKLGDIIGVTMYRKAWADITKKFGFEAYFPLNPVFYARKAGIIRNLFNKKVICIELQAEPWTSKPIMEADIGEQLKSMNQNSLKANIQFAINTGFDTFYLWGVEWWYWMKTTQNHPEIWQEAQRLFSAKI